MSDNENKIVKHEILKNADDKEMKEFLKSIEDEVFKINNTIARKNRFINNKFMNGYYSS